jgi:hypothetical protein
MSDDSPLSSFTAPPDSLQPFSEGRWPRLCPLHPSHDGRKSSQAQLNLRALAWRFGNSERATIGSELM